MSRVITFGLHIADVLGRYVTDIPPGQGLDVIEEIRITVAGTAAATAVDLAKLGVDVATVGAVGCDALGAYIRQAMADAGVNTQALKTVNDVQTSATILPIRPDGSRPALHVVGANSRLKVEDLPEAELADLQVFHLGGLGLMDGVDGEPAAGLLRRMRELGVTTTADCLPTGHDSGYDALLPVLPYVDYFFPSYEDALMIAGSVTRQDAIDYFLDQGIGTLVITMGGEGVSISRRGSSEIRLPAYEVDVVDTTGCGDAFSAGFIVGLLDGLSPTEASEFGLATGSMVAIGLGSDAGIVDRASVEEFRAKTPRKSLPVGCP
jgi:sugar/nucleoside kinase (ribokinase family)